MCTDDFADSWSHVEESHARFLLLRLSLVLIEARVKAGIAGTARLVFFVWNKQMYIEKNYRPSYIPRPFSIGSISMCVCVFELSLYV